MGEAVNQTFQANTTDTRQDRRFRVTGRGLGDDPELRSAMPGSMPAKSLAFKQPRAIRCILRQYAFNGLLNSLYTDVTEAAFLFL